MPLAIEVVNSGSTTITQVANLHENLRQLLQDRISGRVKHSINPGPKPYLSSTEEKIWLEFQLIHQKWVTEHVGFIKQRTKLKCCLMQGPQSEKPTFTNRFLNHCGIFMVSHCQICYETRNTIVVFTAKIISEISCSSQRTG